ncbi:MAG: Xaa-Pro peptidase family protein [Actinomycetota bacterium]
MSTNVSDLPALDHGARLAALAEHIGSLDVDAFLVTDLTDIRWATGFNGSNGWLVIRDRDAVLGTDGRYLDKAREETAGTGVTVIAEQLATRLHERLVESCAGTDAVGIDAGRLTHTRWQQLAGDLAVVNVTSPIGELRRHKDDAEIARIEQAAAATDRALAEVEPILLATTDAPVTEHDIRTELEYRMRLHGADDRSYDTIVAAGPHHAARPHHGATRRPIVEGDMVIIDVGGLVDGYHSDMTRSWVIGEPTALHRELFELTAASQRAGLDALRAGIAARDVDAACRGHFTEHGYGDWFVHGTGHGVGLQIHESPFESRISTETLVAGDVVTVEPGLYRDGVGGVRIEDLAVVTESGHRVLTHSPKREPGTY